MGHWKRVVPRAAALTRKQTSTGSSHLHCTKVFLPFLKICITVLAPCEILIKQKSFEIFIIKNNKPIELFLQSCISFKALINVKKTQFV